MVSMNVTDVPAWQDVIERIMGAKLEAYRGGECLTVGSVVEALENRDRPDFDIVEARARLALLGLGIRDLPAKDKSNPCRGYALAIPQSDDSLNKLFAGDRYYADGGWALVLRGAPDGVVRRNLTKEAGTLKINRVAKTVMLVDLVVYDEWTACGRTDDISPDGECCQPAPFVVGDIVRLKSGGMAMTIKSIAITSKDEWHVWVIYSGYRSLEDKNLPAAALERVPKGNNPSRDLDDNIPF